MVQVNNDNRYEMKKISLIVIGLIALFCFAKGQSKTVNIEIDFTSTECVSKYRAGLTHTQRSIDNWGNAASIANARLLLDSATHYQNQHLMGWGTLNPWPDSTIVDPAKWKWGITG